MIGAAYGACVFVFLMAIKVEIFSPEWWAAMLALNTMGALNG